MKRGIYIKVIILNSGMGTRINKLENFKHKSLIEINDTTIIGNQMDIFIELGIKDFLITTGYNAKHIESYIDSKYVDMDIKVDYIYNGKFNQTNYIYSLYLANEKINSDVILLHGDMYIEKSSIEKILKKSGSTVVINKSKGIDHEDFKALVENDFVKEIGVSLSGESVYSLEPVYKLEYEFIKAWLKEIRNYIEEDNCKVYAENALNKLLDRLELRPIDIESEICMEVDTMDDLESLKELLNRR